MKIDKEKFNKLKQLDRIEFRQKFNFIDRGIGVGLVLGIILLSFSMLFSTLEDKFSSVFFFIMGIAIPLIIINISKKEISKLESEYFTAEVKK